jgi:hypothetical protein
VRGSARLALACCAYHVVLVCTLCMSMQSSPCLCCGLLSHPPCVSQLPSEQGRPDLYARTHADTGLESGTLDIGVSYHGFPIYTQSQDLCDVTQCPVEKGPLTVKLEEPFPIITPPVRERAAPPAVGN